MVLRLGLLGLNIFLYRAKEFSLQEGMRLHGISNSEIDKCTFGGLLQANCLMNNVNDKSHKLIQ